MFTIVFLLLAVNIPTLVLLLGGYLPPNYVTVFLGELVAVSFPFLPLLALPMGSTAIVDEKESGTLEYIMSHPISRFEFILGKLLGMMLATSAVVLLGYGLAAMGAYNLNIAAYAQVGVTLGVALMLNASMLGIAMVLSTLTKRKNTALGIGIFLWFLFTSLSNVTFLTAILSLAVGPWTAVPFVLLNPIQLATGIVPTLTGGSLEQQGSVGLLIQVLFHESAATVLLVCLIVWVVVGLGLTLLIFTRQDLA